MTANHFDTITYLAGGTNSQKQAFDVLTKHQIMEKLKDYEPILAGTIPLNINIEGSDLDVICCFTDKTAFETHLRNTFQNYNTVINTLAINGQETVLANLMADGWEIEIFGQYTPVKQQYAYRHMIIEHTLLQQKGESFRQEIIALKQLGYKTEPAFAKALNLTGNPYAALLAINPANYY